MFKVIFFFHLDIGLFLSDISNQIWYSFLNSFLHSACFRPSQAHCLSSDTALRPSHSKYTRRSIAHYKAINDTESDALCNLYGFKMLYIQTGVSLQNRVWRTRIEAISSHRWLFSHMPLGERYQGGGGRGESTPPSKSSLPLHRSLTYPNQRHQRVSCWRKSPFVSSSISCSKKKIRRSSGGINGCNLCLLAEV